MCDLCVVAADATTPIDILKKLSKNNVIAIRIEILNNPVLPMDILMTFAQDKKHPTLQSMALIKLRALNNLVLTQYVSTLSQGKKKKLLKLLK